MRTVVRTAVQVPEQPELLESDTDGKYRVYRLPDGTVTIVDTDLRIYTVYASDYYAEPDPDLWIGRLRSVRPVRTSYMFS